MQIVQTKKVTLNLRLSVQDYEQFTKNKSLELQLDKLSLAQIGNMNWETDNSDEECMFFIKIEYET